MASVDNCDYRRLTAQELRTPSLIPENNRRFMPSSVYSDSGGTTTTFVYNYEGRDFLPLPGYFWRTTEDGFDRLNRAGRLCKVGNYIRYRMYGDDYPIVRITNYWDDVRAGGFGEAKVFAVQTATDVIQRCIQMTTDPGDLVFDPTCGSGTTAYVAEQWGRRWITCDTSRVAITLAQQRLMTALYDYYELAYPDEGIRSGFNYRNVPHITLRSIVNNHEINKIWEEHEEKLSSIRHDLSVAGGESRVLDEWEIPRECPPQSSTEVLSLHTHFWKERIARQKDIDAAIARHAPQETLYDQPLVDRSKRRVTGPFSVEAVPSPVVMPIDEAALSEADDSQDPKPEPDDSVVRSGETLRQAEWRDELLKTGIRGKSGQFIHFSRLEPLPGCRHLHADGETLPNDRGADSVRDQGAARASQRVVVSFGPDHAPLEQRQVAQALEEAHSLVPTPKVIVFAAFQFDPEAAKDIDETRWPGIALLKAQMNADLLTEDLKRKRASNESFWLIGQPDVVLHQIRRGHNIGKWQIYVRGFDYYNTKTGQVESGGEDQIAMWMLDTDYDGRSLYPRQVFFPMSGSRDGWNRLARNLKAEIDVDLIEAYGGTVSLPFEMGEHSRVAVKIVDDRGIESLRIIST